MPSVSGPKVEERPLPRLKLIFRITTLLDQHPRNQIFRDHHQEGQQWMINYKKGLMDIKRQMIFILRWEGKE